MLTNILFYPVKILWNGLLIVLTIWAFIGWWSLIFGSIVAIVLILIFSAYHILFLPMMIMGLYVPFVTDEGDSELVHVLGLAFTALIVGLIVNSF